MPYWNHDCDSCAYLGSAQKCSAIGGEMLYYDFYVCMGRKNLSGRTLIARYADRDCDYYSSPSQLVPSVNSELTTAAWLAAQQGYIDVSEVCLVGTEFVLSYNTAILTHGQIRFLELYGFKTVMTEYGQVVKIYKVFLSRIEAEGFEEMFHGVEQWTTK
jgi:hypothetical protein